jgi:Tol biopolymer transport system component
MTLAHGVRIGPYEIQALIGAGGMGEVYRAIDTRLGRIVAIKVLSAAARDRPNAQRRFEQEARAASHLHHPHICGLFDLGEVDGTSFLVMEYLEGETLDSRVTRGALPLADVRRYALDIADALAHAHRHGIVHRDLKPSNVMLTRDGATLLDFGLAKLQRLHVPGGAAPIAATMTAETAIIGTLNYMAPEQLNGGATDARADLFAFGAVIYEMLTGRGAFDGNSHASIIAAILERPVAAPSAIRSDTPPPFDAIVTRCLEKRPDDRWQSAADVHAALELTDRGVSSPRRRSSATGSSVARGNRWTRAGIAAGVLAAVALAALVFLPWHRVTANARTVRFVVEPPAGANFTQSSAFLAVSPDGRSLAFVASSQDGKLALWTQPLDSLTAREVVKNGAQPFWSADSQSIAFNTGKTLEKIEARGGVPQALADARSQSGSWNRDGVVLFKGAEAGIMRVATSRGTPAPATTPDKSLGETSHDWPQFLPDGRHFLYLARSTQPEHDGIVYAATLGSDARIRLVRSDSNVMYGEPGFLLYMQGNTLLAQPFDATRLHVSGEPIPIASNVERNPGSRRGAFSVSQNGVLAYRATSDTELVWFDRTGKRLGVVGTAGSYSNPALSPDEKQLAVARVDPQVGTSDIWMFDLARGMSSRLTTDPASEDMPLWSPDGRQLLFKSTRPDGVSFRQRPIDGGRDAVLWTGRGPDGTPLSWSPDQRFLVFGADGAVQHGNFGDVLLLPTAAGGTPRPLLDTPFKETQAQVSPDGRWLAYVSNESTTNEVYVRAFPSGERTWRVSVDGGVEPAWRADGQELFYLGANGDLMAAAVTTGDSFAIQPPERLFTTAMLTGLVNVGYTRNQYAVADRGQRFLINQRASSTPKVPITVVINWPADLTR